MSPNKEDRELYIKRSIFQIWNTQYKKINIYLDSSTIFNVFFLTKNKLNLLQCIRKSGQRYIRSQHVYSKLGFGTVLL